MFIIFENTVTVHKKIQGAITLAVALKIRPRTKHTWIKYRKFWSLVGKGDIEINNVSTKEQIIDNFMKQLDTELFGYLNYKLNGW